MGIHFKETPYGFEYGRAKVTRIHSDKKTGAVYVGLNTQKRSHELQIYVTKTGKVRVFGVDGEWLPPKPEGVL